MASAYYDDVYRQLIADPDHEGWDWLDERVSEIAPLIVGESVLDLGCGLARMADAVDIAYRGVDFSRVAYEWNLANVQNPKATFGVGDIFRHIGSRGFDTVLILEVLEHIEEPERLVTVGMRAAIERVIVTVPVNMPGRAHLHPRWDRADVDLLLGGADQLYTFGGPEKDRWWLGVKDRAR